MWIVPWQQQVLGNERVCHYVYQGTKYLLVRSTTTDAFTSNSQKEKKGSMDEIYFGNSQIDTAHQHIIYACNVVVEYPSS